MVKKLITFSFAPDSIGGFCCICNGVQTTREKHFSACIPMTKQAFIEALHDRIKFNELLGIDIREGWQNALKDAIEPFTTMREECDPAVVADAIAQADVNVRGVEKVEADMAEMEKINEQLTEKIEEEVKKDEKSEKNVKKSHKTSKKAKKEVKNDEGTTDATDASVESAGSSDSAELPAETGSTGDNA